MKKLEICRVSNRVGMNRPALRSNQRLIGSGAHSHFAVYQPQSVQQVEWPVLFQMHPVILSTTEMQDPRGLLLCLEDLGMLQLPARQRLQSPNPV